MRIVVDVTKCQGYAQCAFLAPDVFTIQGDETLVYDPHPDGAQQTPVGRAAAACPVQAIRLEQVNRPNGSLPLDHPPAAPAAAVEDGATFKRTGRIVRRRSIDGGAARSAARPQRHWVPETTGTAPAESSSRRPSCSTRRTCWTSPRRR
jgi:ferredoxin